jgi:hypothetical protein
MNLTTIKRSTEPIFPFIQQVRDPFSTEVVIQNRPAGYRPLQYVSIEVIEDDEDIVPMFQTACDVILPKNLKYRKTREFPTQP